MTDLFWLKPELYYDYAAKASPEQKKLEIENRIASDEYIGSIKKDGDYNRCVIHNGELKMQTRSISTITREYGNHYDKVPHLVRTLQNLPNETLIIGELYYPGKTSKDVGSILRCLPAKAVARQEGDYGYLYYYIHDIWFFNGQDLTNTPYEDRIKILIKVYNEYLKENKYIERAKYASSPDTINSMIAQARADNEEGIVLVRKDATVNPGARTAWKTLKVKKELDNEVDCFFTGGYKEPTKIYTGKEIESWIYWYNEKEDKMMSGPWYEEYQNGTMSIIPVTKPYFYGWAGSLEIGLLHKGKIEVFGYISGVTDEIKKDYVENPEKWKFRPLSVNAMQFTEDHKLRHGRFVRLRDDLEIEDCTYEKCFGSD